MTVKEKRKKMVAILSELKEPLSEFDLDFINEMRKVDSLLIEAYELLGLDSIMEMDYSLCRFSYRHDACTSAPSSSITFLRAYFPLDVSCLCHAP